MITNSILKFSGLILAILITIAGFSQSNEILSEQEGPYFATGIRIGDVSQNEAIVWTRLTKNKTRVNNALLPISIYTDPESGEKHLRKTRRDKNPLIYFPDGHDIETIEGAVPGKTGEVRLKYKIKTAKKWTITKWNAVAPEANFSKKFILSNLKSGMDYDLLVEGKPTGSEKISATLNGKFKTAPDAKVSRKVTFGVSTGQGYGHQDRPDGFKIYPLMLEVGVDFFVHTGDIIYYDNLAKNKAMAYYHWDRMFSIPTNKDFHSQVSSYFEKDDHDTWYNDSYRGMSPDFMGDFTFDQGLEIFRQEMPIKNKTYRTFRWGKDLQIWLVEGRDFRSPNTAPDGPEKTIWGKEQMEWFKRTVKESDATFKLLISPTPIIGPDRKTKKDNHANPSFRYEGDIIRSFLAEQKNMYSICGDRHWQYVSKHKKTGTVEFSSGPASDAHAGGWKQEDFTPEHLYLNVIGGMMTVTIDPDDGGSISVNHYDVNGKIRNEFKAKAK
ncbi:alkaline phosphatase D family protein [Flavobacteriaceae bacterium]|nr:alkaline phosphatase D family protein [Flavobacteriaceae bacterium]